MKKIFVDTDILINFSKGASGVLGGLLALQNQEKVELIVNPVVVAEFFFDQTLKNMSKREQAVDFFQQFTLVEISKKMGFTAGELIREKKVLFIGDALIAATCLVAGLALATRNRRHFGSVTNLQFYESDK